MSELRAARILILFLIWTLALIPVQVVALWLNSPIADRLPPFYHRGVARLFGLKIRCIGKRADDHPVLYVSNHISWLDIVVLGGTLNASFIAKHEIATWPFFGLLARLQRTVFIERKARRTADHRDEMVVRLEQDHSLILFPEGTSDDGLRVLPFKSAFFVLAERPVNGRHITVQPISVGYSKLHGMPVGRRAMPIFAWVGDEDLAPHLWTYLKAGPAEAVIIFHEPINIERFANRKAMTAHCHDEVRRGLSEINAGRI